MKRQCSDRVDSQSSSSDSEGQMPNDLPQEKQTSRVKKRTYLLAIVFFVVVMLQIYWFLQTKSHQNTKIPHDIQVRVNLSSSFPRSQGLDHLDVTKQQKQQPVQQTVIVQLGQTKLIGNSNYIWKQLREGNMLWFDVKDVICEPDKIVNSASKIQENLFLQKTAYYKIHIAYPKVNIPVQNLYRLQGPRQLIQNISKRGNIKIAFAHSDPLLLVLTASYSPKGFFVFSLTDWALFKRNLILNDLLPLAKPIASQAITTNQGYDFLISDDFSLVKTLLFDQKRQIVMLIEVREPITAETSVLLKIKTYRLEKAQQCQPRVVFVYQQSSWHISQQATLMPNWYVFTLQSMAMPIQLQKKDYESPLFKPRSLHCIKEQSYKQSTLPINSYYVIQNIPYGGLYLLRKGHQQQILDHYHPIFSYLKSYPPSNIYLHSGSSYLALLALSTLRKGSKVSVSSNYDLSILKKNIVLNSLEVFFEQKNEENPQLVITTDLQGSFSLNPAKIILINAKPSQVLTGYTVRKFKQSEQCTEVDMILVNEATIAEGKYLIVNDRYIV